MPACREVERPSLIATRWYAVYCTGIPTALQSTRPPEVGDSRSMQNSAGFGIIRVLRRKTVAMSYREALNYIAQKTPVIELYDQLGARVAVCPEWNGRIMTTACEGLEGESFGCIDVHAVESNRFENFGGEDHWTISPLIHTFNVESIKESQAVLQRTISMTDTRGKRVELNLTRKISLLSRKKIGVWFGKTVADALELEDVSAVGFRTENTVKVNEKAHIAGRLRGMYNATPHTFVIVSTPAKNWTAESLMKDTVPFNINYLGGSPHGRTRYVPQALLIQADGDGRCQVTLPYSAAPPILGAVDFGAGTLTLWTFDVPGNAEDTHSDEDLIRIYNSGRIQTNRTGEVDWLRYFELNCFSEAQKLLPEEMFVYRQHTLHLIADNRTLGDCIREIFDVPLEQFPKRARRT